MIGRLIAGFALLVLGVAAFVIPEEIGPAAANLGAFLGFLALVAGAIIVLSALVSVTKPVAGSRRA